MLKDLTTQGTEDKVNWEKYQQWSDTTEVDKNDFKQEQNALVMSTEAMKNANMQQVQKLTSDLAQLAADIQQTYSSIAELVKMRHEEHTEFEAALADLTRTIKAVTKAVDILEGHYAADKASLAEVRSRVQMALTMYGLKMQPDEAKAAKALAGFLQGGAAFLQGTEPDYLSVDGAQKYGSYSSQAGGKGVVGMLEDVRTQLESQKQDLITKENEARNQFDETKAAKEGDLQRMQAVQSEKTTTKANSEATISECSATIDQAKKDIADAEAYLALLVASRAKFTNEYKDRYSLRAQEQAATQAALDALQAVSAGAKSTVGASSLLQKDESAPRKSALLQVSAFQEKRLKSTFQSLVSLGKEMKSAALVKAAATALQAPSFDAGSMGPVKQLLTDLITRLEEEANAETSQHEWCETEKSHSTQNKEEREKNIHDLKGTIESLTTEIATLKTEIVFMQSEITRVETETQEASQIRVQAHELYLQSKKDHEEVIAAIGAALGALSGQYGLLQVRHTQSRQPSSPFASYASGGSGAASAMEMLEDLRGRYSTALSQLIGDEKTAVAAHEHLLTTNKKFVADTKASVNSKTAERRAAIIDLGEDKAELKTNLVELHEVAKYLQDLRPSCDDIRSTFEERKKRREAEISALKEALDVLSDPSGGSF